MDRFRSLDGLSFLIVLFKATDCCYLLPFETLIHYWNEAQKGGRKSIPADAFDPKYLINPHGHLRLHYLEALNTYLNALK